MRSTGIAQGEAFRVLLLEDSGFDAELLTAALEANYPNVLITWVKGGDDFTAALRRGAFDVVLSDYQLPGFSGAQALELAQQVTPDTPFIFVSGVIGEDNVVDLLKLGATDYVIKGRFDRLPVAIDRARREVAQRQARSTAESQLREADALYARVVDSLQDHAVLLLDRDGRIRSWNRAAESIFGWTIDQVRGRSSELLLPPDERGQGLLAKELAHALAKGSSDYDHWLMRANGSKLRVEGTVTPLLHANGELYGFSKIIRDTTERYQAAQAIRQAKEEAERANAAKDRFLAVLSHELRTPLTPIVAAAHVLQRVCNVPEKFKHLLPMIQRNVDLEARLIDDLLDLTSIGAGKLTLRMQPVDLHRLIGTVIEMVDAEIQTKKLDVKVQLDAAPCWIDGDEARLQQVVWNIVRNAVKFTPEGGAIRLSTEQNEGWVTLRCTDTGFGIHPDALPRLFTAFEQADAEVSQRFGGLGLGLTIANGLVREHRGTISVASEGRGRGATFEVRLPTLKQQGQGASGLDGNDAASALSERRLLLIEDNIDAAEAMAISLRDFGYDVVHAATQREAMQIASDGRFDLAITDIGLPDGNGIDLGRHLLPSMPVIALSGYGAERDRHASSEAGFSGHLVKPVDPQEVHRLVQAVLDRAGKVQLAAMK
jgi:PAS domain S-box-containing protein